ncbi:hypothetical protein, variant 3 [Aphanomyces astaci]|uniref:Coiled-coil domain-containing protein 61 n=1 Tax=Aphanomyces astaci TaxID=112090 RepID=W4H887_APHAT|nr:hypothetical protein, variant 3 [Aphanomyces astaci]ETV88245.1 hypothetical protein, variant 3 [Aphanomyces astaci]|eukprot:XP_009823107.1 hypothetical protein, variant 3 [Aphanomyces astaci]
MDSERGLEASGSMCFHGVEYYVHVWVESDELHVQVEEQSVKGGADSDRWGAHFPSLYIEELTKKTGNFKRFYTFVNMLMSALQHKSESVFIDLLTYSDLELYRKRKLGKSAPSTKLPDPVAALNNKRYLILTYAVEFDRVHYPLPLNFVETPSPAMLQRTIRRLKQTLLETRTSSIDDPANKTLASMQAENASLRLRIQQLQDTREDNQDDLSSSVVHLKRQLQAATTEHKELSTLYQQLRKESAKEIQALRDQLEDHTRRSQDAPDDSQYIQRIRQLERDLDRAADEQARLTSDLKQQVTDATRELNATSTTVQELQLKNRELLRQLAIQRTKSNPQPKSKVPIDRPKDVASPSSKYTKKPRRPGSAASSDSEGNFDKKPSSTLNFKRFDPTAYHVPAYNYHHIYTSFCPYTQHDYTARTAAETPSAVAVPQTTHTDEETAAAIQRRVLVRLVRRVPLGGVDFNYPEVEAPPHIFKSTGNGCPVEFPSAVHLGVKTKGSPPRGSSSHPIPAPSHHHQDNCGGRYYYYPNPSIL